MIVSDEAIKYKDNGIILILILILVFPERLCTYLETLTNIVTRQTFHWDKSWKE